MLCCQVSVVAETRVEELLMEVRVSIEMTLQVPCRNALHSTNENAMRAPTPMSSFYLSSGLAFRTKASRPECQRGAVHA